MDKIKSIQVTPEMRSVGVAAWEDAAGVEYPATSIINDMVVEEIFLAMARLSSLRDERLD